MMKLVQPILNKILGISILMAGKRREQILQFPLETVWMIFEQSMRPHPQSTNDIFLQRQWMTRYGGAPTETVEHPQCVYCSCSLYVASCCRSTACRMQNKLPDQMVRAGMHEECYAKFYVCLQCRESACTNKYAHNNVYPLEPNISSSPLLWEKLAEVLRRKAMQQARAPSKSPLAEGSA